MSTSIVVVNAGVSVPSSTKLLADQLSAQVRADMATAGVDAQFTTIELRRHARALTEAMLAGFPTGELAEATAGVAGADGVIAVTPTYSASYSGLFKSFFDILDPDALRGTPVIMAATGGTERHSLVTEFAMRPLFTYLGALPTTTAVYAATADFGAYAAALAQRVERASAEFVAAVGGAGLVTRNSAPQEFTEFIPMDELLGD